MRIASVLACLLAPGLVWSAPAAANPDEKSPETIRKALDQPVTLRINRQTLAAAVEALGKQAKINIVLDGPTTQQQLGFAPDQPNVQVQLDAKDMKARTALRSILAPATSATSSSATRSSSPPTTRRRRGSCASGSTWI